MPLATAARPLPATAPATLHPHQPEGPRVRLWAMLDLPDDVPRPHDRGTPAFAAMLDQLSGGRAAIHVISGGDDQDQARDGDWLGKDDRCARTDGYVGVLKRVWTADAPVDHESTYYRIQGASPAVETVQRPRVLIYFGGATDAAICVAGRYADVYAP